ncbi:hypothetical protein EMPG_10872 [Blastomyces silverae]|uniref:Uncharacterized protein n=1 Tax=Blastomyces silverae TaxID=2060906 RepID=A0A0H1B3L1_9EURO|nr:hypothetical protein EMPG_10872 [Blastomyces silverae]
MERKKKRQESRRGAGGGASTYSSSPQRQPAQRDLRGRDGCDLPDRAAGHNKLTQQTAACDWPDLSDPAQLSEDPVTGCVIWAATPPNKSRLRVFL